MTKAELLAAVSRIERAPNMSAVVRAYDAALGGSDVSVHRHQGAWQVWHGEASGLCGDFTEIRSHLARDAEETLERMVEEAVQAPAMIPQPAQLQQACAAPRVAMDLRRTVTTHGIVAVDMASAGPCPEFPDHGRDEYRVTAAGQVIRTRYVLASDHARWSSPGAKPFITPNRTTVTARRTIDAVAECLAAKPAAPAMVPQVAQQQQACAAPAAPPRLSRDELLVRIKTADRQYAEAVAEMQRKWTDAGRPSRLELWLADGPRAMGVELREQLAELDREAMKNPPAAGFSVVKAWVDDADVFQTRTFPLVSARAEDATGEIVSLLGGRDPTLFSAAEKQAGALLTMEEVGSAPTA